MIEEISISDLGVIQLATLPLGPGLTVITGETGAGKTMVLTALGLLLGKRSDSGAVRAQAAQAFVEGIWRLDADTSLNSVSASIKNRLEDAGLEFDKTQLLVNRAVSVDGRSKSSVNGRTAPVSLLTEISEDLVVIHGQSDQLRLKSSSAQRDALDQFGGASLRAALLDYQTSFRFWKESEATLARMLADADNRERQMAEMREILREVDAVDPQPGELEKLTALAERLGNIDELRRASALAHDAIFSSELDAPDAIGALAAARKALESVESREPKLGELAGTLREIASNLNDVAADLSSYISDLEGDSEYSLDWVMERRASINGLLKKYSMTFEQLLDQRDMLATRLADLDSSDSTIEQLRVGVKEHFAEAQDLAQRLSALRSEAAAKLSDYVSRELSGLAMANTLFHSTVTELPELTLYGKDEVQFQLSNLDGSQLRPITKGASGGELSRIMLALEVVLAKSIKAPTLIFDEVDAGVGGAAAIEVGKRLARLASQAQVIVVTHLAQVAAFADSHIRVLKNSDSHVTTSDISVLDEQNRVLELARMLSGLEDSNLARAHARELLTLASQSRI